MHIKNLLLIIFQICSVMTLVSGQVNTEAMRDNNESYGFTNVFGFDFGFEKSNQEVVDIAGK